MKTELLSITLGGLLLVTVAAKRDGYFASETPAPESSSEGFVKIQGASIDGSDDLRAGSGGRRGDGMSGPGDPIALPGAHSTSLKERLAKRADGDPIQITWEDIAWFEYETPDPLEEDPEVLAALKDQIPDSVKELDGQKVTIEGYMNPLKLEEGRVRSFYLYRHFQNCCFGQASRLTDVIKVEVTMEDGAEFLPYAVVMVTGALEVGEKYDDYGYVSSVFRMQAEAVVEKW